jgi:DNA-binding transcriptional LysR family regulator
MQIDFLGIQAFLAVAETGGFGQAAARLHLSQTAISHRMRKLEDSLGVQLVVRTSRGISLTQAGEALLPRARQSVRELQESCEAVARQGQAAPHWVTFGCLPTIAEGLLAPLLRRVQAAHPQLPVRVFDSSPTEILELVQARTAAFGITLDQPSAPGLSVRTIGREPFVLACPPQHPLARREAVGWAELVGEPLVRISLPSGNSATIDDKLGPLRESLAWVYETQRTAVALTLVRAGLGLTVVPRLAVQEQDGVALVPLRDPGVGRMLVLLTRQGETLDGPEQLIAELAIELLRQSPGLAVP